MAALLKKRALAQYSQVLQETPSQGKAKRLKLTHKAKATQVKVELSVNSSDHTNLCNLLRLEQSLPVPIPQVSPLLNALLEHYYIEQSSVVRAKIAGLLGALSKSPGVDIAVIEQEMKNALQKEASHVVKSQLLGAMISIGRALPGDKALHARLTDIAIQHLTDSSHLVLCKCLELVGVLSYPGDNKDCVSKQTLITFTQHDDPRVRQQAYQAMLLWHSRGIILERNIYDSLTAGLKDDYEGVRIVAVKLVWVLSLLYPESPVEVKDSPETLRLVDNGFSLICDMVNDICTRVRVQAASLLGSLHLVSERFLEQTLDKKLISNMRRKVSAHDRQKEHFTSGEWSTGNKWADDKPREQVDGENISLMSTGACGAFVHGLEDEFLEVRSATIDSVCELASRSESFARLSQDFIIDMLNDEIESVRLNAIESVRKISHHLMLREDQLDIILSALKDYSYDIREALRSMLCCVRLGTEGSINICVKALLDNIKRYPQDRDSIWRCMKELGVHHTTLTIPLIAELLGLHPYFDTPEPEMDEPAYISVLILVFNAVSDCPTALPMFNHHTLNHYTYLRNTIPHLVPAIKLPLSPDHLTSSGNEDGQTSSSSCETFLIQTMERIKTVSNTDPHNTQTLINTLIRDLQYVVSSDSTVSATAQCLSLYLKCTLVIDQVISSRQQDCLHSMLEVLELSSEIEYLYRGLSMSVLACVYQMRLRAHTLMVIAKLHQGGTDTKHICIHYLKGVSNLHRFLQSNSLPIDMFSTAVFSHMSALESCDPNVYISCLPSVLPHYRPACTLPLDHTHLLNRVRATMVQPTSDISNEPPMRFKAGLTVALPIIATIDNVNSLEKVHIRVRYPDQTEQLSLPRVTDFKRISAYKHKLVTQVSLTHQTWSDASNVQISLVLSYDSDRSLLLEACDSKHVLELCKPVSVQLAPRHVKDAKCF